MNFFLVKLDFLQPHANVIKSSYFSFQRGGHLRNLSYADYMQQFNSAQRSTRPHLRQHYQDALFHRRADTGKSEGKAGDKSAEKPKSDGDDKSDDKTEDDKEDEAEIKFKVPYLSSRDIKPGMLIDIHVTYCSRFWIN